MMSVKPKEKTPYDHLQAALIAVSAARLAVIDGPNPPKQANGSELVRGGNPEPLDSARSAGFPPKNCTGKA